MFYKKLLRKEVNFTMYPLCVNIYSSNEESQTFWKATKYMVCKMMGESDNNSVQSCMQQPFNNTTTTSNTQQLTVQIMEELSTDANVV